MPADGSASAEPDRRHAIHSRDGKPQVDAGSSPAWRARRNRPVPEQLRLRSAL